MEEKNIGRRSFLKTATMTAAGILATSSCSETANKQSSKTAEQSSERVEQPSEAAAMPLKELGKTGVKIPILQLGTSQSLDPVYDKVLHLCFKEGVIYLDTALSYGWGASHRAIANFIKQVEDRKKLWITSKSGDRSPEGLIAGIDKCLAELETDYLDLYLMHGINDVRMLDKAFLEAGDKLRKSGKTHFFGFSCHDGNVVELLNKAAEVGGIDAILFRYNFRQYGDRELNLAIDACSKAGIGLMAMKTMASVPKDIEKVVEFRSQNFTLGQAKLKSVWADQRIDSLVSEMSSVKMARENITAAKSQKTIKAEEMHQLNRLAALTASYACNGCSHLCESAVGGKIAIADSLRYLMYYESYGKQARARELYQTIPLEARNFETADLNKASAVCPQRIDIAARLGKAKSVLAG
ncbi:MAG: aldo/keto reductase [Nitrospira sp.]|nr:aldo/keto reductase [Nitrospira sp.]